MRNAFASALLVGDAASLVDPLTGEGIHNALVSARLAVDTIAGALRGGRSGEPVDLSSYDRRCREVLGPLIARSHRVHRWADRAPWWIDLLFWLAGTAPGWTERILNRMSNDFVVRVDG
jgi:flavin-dependent dehydrogenase